MIQPLAVADEAKGNTLREKEQHMPAAVETMMSVREVPWHGLGTILDDYPETKEAAMAAAGLDWTVAQAPIYYREEDGTFTEWESNSLTYRVEDRQPFGVVGTSYKEIQNESMFDFVQALYDTHDVKIETAGSLRQGRIVWALAKIERPVVVAGDEILPYLLIANGHDGLTAFSARLTPTRVVCANTLQIAMRNATTKWSIRHTQNWQQYVDQARVTLNLSFEYYGKFEEEVKHLIDTPVSNRKLGSLLTRLIPTSENERSETTRAQQRDEIKSLYLSSPTVGFTGTAWGALNAISEWELWTRPKESAFADVTQARKILSGNATPLTEKAHKILLASR